MRRNEKNINSKRYVLCLNALGIRVDVYTHLQRSQEGIYLMITISYLKEFVSFLNMPFLHPLIFELLQSDIFYVNSLIQFRKF